MPFPSLHLSYSEIHQIYIISQAVMDFAAQPLQITNNRNTLFSKTHNELKLEACGKFSWFWLMKIYSLHCETFSLQPDIKVTLTGSIPIQQQHFTIIFLNSSIKYISTYPSHISSRCARNDTCI